MNNNYQFLLADDHKGNKLFAIIKGDFTPALISHTKTIANNSIDKKTAIQLQKLIDSTTITDKGGE